MEFVGGSKKKMCLWFKGNEESERCNAVNSLPFKGFPLVGGYENLSPCDLTFGLAMVTLTSILVFGGFLGCQTLGEEPPWPWTGKLMN